MAHGWTRAWSDHLFEEFVARPWDKRDIARLCELVAETRERQAGAVDELLEHSAQLDES